MTIHPFCNPREFGFSAFRYIDDYCRAAVHSHDIVRHFERWNILADYEVNVGSAIYSLSGRKRRHKLLIKNVLKCLPVTAYLGVNPRFNKPS